MRSIDEVDSPPFAREPQGLVCSINARAHHLSHARTHQAKQADAVQTDHHHVAPWPLQAVKHE
jgi:hypothetical protein